jgi:Penicillinase repressor
MRRFGELEAVIIDRLWEWGRPALVREMVHALHEDRALAYATVMTVSEEQVMNYVAERLLSLPRSYLHVRLALTLLGSAARA